MKNNAGINTSIDNRIDWEIVLDSMEEPIMILDLGSRIIKCNKALGALIGLPVENLLGRTCGAVIHDGGRSPSNCPVMKMVASRSRQSANQYIKDKWFNVVVDPLVNACGELTGAVHVMYDITDLKNFQTKDLLTSLYNRDYFETRLAKIKTGKSCGIIYCDIDGLELINDSLGFRQGNKLLVDVATILKKSLGEETIVARFGEDSFAALLGRCRETEIIDACRSIRMAVEDYNHSQGRDLLSLSLGYGFGGKLAASPQELLWLARDQVRRQKLLSRKSVRCATMATMQRLLAVRDLQTGQHSDRSQELVAHLASNMGLNESSIDNLRLLGRFHDIGKIGVSDVILLKPGKLNAEEFSSMAKHCEIGYYIAKSLPDVVHIADWILKHHERWDGTGYPLKLRAEQIPLECRIMAVVDAYDAMMSDRPYRKALDQVQALDELVHYAGTQFDPVVVSKFIAYFPAKFREQDYDLCRNQGDSNPECLRQAPRMLS